MPRLCRERRSVTGGPGSCVPRSMDGEHALVTSLLVGHPCAVGVGRGCHASAHVVLRRGQLVHRYRFCLFQHRQHRLSPSAQRRTTQNEWRPTHGPRQVEALIRTPVSRTVSGHSRVFTEIYGLTRPRVSRLPRPLKIFAQVRRIPMVDATVKGICRAFCLCLQVIPRRPSARCVPLSGERRGCRSLRFFAVAR